MKKNREIPRVIIVEACFRETNISPNEADARRSVSVLPVLEEQLVDEDSQNYLSYPVDTNLKFVAGFESVECLSSNACTLWEAPSNATHVVNVSRTQREISRELSAVETFTNANDAIRFSIRLYHFLSQCRLRLDEADLRAKIDDFGISILVGHNDYNSRTLISIEKLGLARPARSTTIQKLPILKSFKSKDGKWKIRTKLTFPFACKPEFGWKRIEALFNTMWERLDFSTWVLWKSGVVDKNIRRIIIEKAYWADLEAISSSPAKDFTAM